MLVWVLEQPFHSAIQHTYFLLKDIKNKIPFQIIIFYLYFFPFKVADLLVLDSSREMTELLS